MPTIVHLARLLSFTLCVSASSSLPAMFNNVPLISLSLSLSLHVCVNWYAGVGLFCRCAPVFVCACMFGVCVCSLWMRESERKEIRCWELESTSLWRKFLGPFDLVFSLFSSAEHVFFSLSPLLTHATMLAHHSQYVWFRRLFVLFSRYSYLNTLRLKQR
jgi:hypothetical protein